MISESKIKGMLLGLHVGDSLGSTLEFKDANPSLSHTQMIGGGVFKWNPGDATDDTDLMICVLKSIQNKTFLEGLLKTNMIEWYNNGPKDIGNATSIGIEFLINHKIEPDKNSLGNGSLMRVAPLALLDHLTDNELIDIVSRQTKITHPNILCSQIDLLFIKILQKSLAGYTKQELLEYIVKITSKNEIVNKVIKKIPITKWENLSTSGHVLDSFVAAIWTFYHSTDFEKALILLVNKGDDSDTCGAIAGALLGSFYGIEAIPSRWLLYQTEE